MQQHVKTQYKMNEIDKKIENSNIEKTNEIKNELLRMSEKIIEEMKNEINLKLDYQNKELKNEVLTINQEINAIKNTLEKVFL